MWLDGVVPFTVEGISGKVESSQFVIGNLDAGRIGVAILAGHHCYPFFGGRRRNQFSYDLKGEKWLRSPVEGNERKEPMFDLVATAR
jgi:hypothetical protein